LATNSNNFEILPGKFFIKRVKMIQITTTLSMIVKIIQLVILAIAILGTGLVFYNSPFIDSQTYIYTSSEDAMIIKKDSRKRKFARVGFGLILISYVLQTIILFLTK